MLLYTIHSCTTKDSLTIHRSFARQYDTHQLEACEGTLEVTEHGLHLVRSIGILAETWLTNYGHPCERSTQNHKHVYLVYLLSYTSPKFII